MSACRKGLGRATVARKHLFWGVEVPACTLQAHLSCYCIVLLRQGLGMLESTRVHTRVNIKGHPSNLQRDVHTSLQHSASLPSTWITASE